MPVVAAKLRMPQNSSHAVARLDALMNKMWRRRLGLVVGPAGSGKTTLITRFAAAAGAPVAWYRCESWDVGAQHLLRHLEEAFSAALGARPRNWQTVEDAIAELEGWRGERILLVIDDAHTIAGTPAESELERVIEYAPPSLLTVIASRTQPTFNISRLRVSGELEEVTGDDLRMRSWEVEDLFRQYYREPLPPIELAELARRTGGWAAGLQLFHLATSGKGIDERRRVLRALSGGSRLVREYLARNVLDELPVMLREFLIETCVLGRLNGPICNEFLTRADSELILQELERRQIFTTAVGDGGDYRYHEVLRSHLEHALVSSAGERALKAKYGKAGVVLEQFGALPEALHAYCRAEDWSAVGHVLGDNGARLAHSAGVWIDALPPGVLDHDPWLLLASARRHRAEGRWQSAIEAYQHAEAGFTGLEAAQICQRERQSLAAWLAPAPTPAVDSVGLLRWATIREPSTIRAQLYGSSVAQDTLVAGLASLLAGDLHEAHRLLSCATDSEDESDAALVAARLGAAVVALLAGDYDALRDLELAVEDADARGQGFLARLGRAASALAPGAAANAVVGPVRAASEHIGDVWGAALASLLQGLSIAIWGVLETGAAPILEGAADKFHELGATVLEAWARGLNAFVLSELHDPAALATALKAESLANASGVEGPKLFIYLALSRSDAWHSARFYELAQTTAAQTGLSVRALDSGHNVTEPAPSLSVTISCFGEFRVVVNGHPIPRASMKPRTRALLRRLCVDAGLPVHRDVLQEALWPNADAEFAARNLHVAISSLRQALEPGVARGASSLIVREAETYRLVVPAGSEVDVNVFDQALERCRRASLARDIEAALQAYRRAAQMAAQELLPEEGSADWIVQRRERVRANVADAARTVARQLLATGQPSSAAEVAASALGSDRYDDELWRLLIQAHEQAGDEAGARRAQADYRRVVSELEPRPR